MRLLLRPLLGWAPAVRSQARILMSPRLVSVVEETVIAGGAMCCAATGASCRPHARTHKPAPIIHQITWCTEVFWAGCGTAAFPRAGAGGFPSPQTSLPVHWVERTSVWQVLAALLAADHLEQAWVVSGGVKR